MPLGLCIGLGFPKDSALWKKALKIQVYPDPTNVRRTWNVDVKIKLSLPKSCSEGSGSQPACTQSLKGFLSVSFELLVNRREKNITQVEEFFPLLNYSDMARGSCIV